MFKDNSTLHYKIISPIFLLFLLFLYRSYFSFLFYGGSDATNVNSFSLLFEYGVDVYSLSSHWPYFPLANSFLIFCNIVASNFKIEPIQIYRFITTIFDFFTSCIIFFYWNKTYSVTKSLIISSLYLINPLSIIIVTILGFNESIFIYFLILSLILLKDGKNNYLSILFLSISISIKPISLILIPYYFFKSKNSIYALLLLTISLFFINFYYFYEFGFLNFYNLLSDILYKFIYGTQISGLGISFFNYIIDFKILKLVTIVGILLSLSLYVDNLYINKFYFISIIFISLIIFRYNAHPQYFLWSIPFLFFTKKWNLAVFFSFFSAITIFFYTFHWNKNGASFITLTYLLDYFRYNSLLISQSTFDFTKMIYSIGNIICLILAFFILGPKKIVVSVINNFLLIIYFLKKINLKYFAINIIFLSIILFFIFDKIFLFFDNYNFLYFVSFYLFPLIFLSLLSSIKCVFQWKYLSFYYFIILLSLVLLFYEYQNLNILSYLTLFFLIINFKNIIKNYLNRELKESI